MVYTYFFFEISIHPTKNVNEIMLINNVYAVIIVLNIVLVKVYLIYQYLLSQDTRLIISIVA